MSLVSTVPSTAIAGTYLYQSHCSNSLHKLDAKPNFTHEKSHWRLLSSSNPCNIEIKKKSRSPSMPDQIKNSVVKNSDTNTEIPSRADQLKPFAKDVLDRNPLFNDAYEPNKDMTKYKPKSVWINPNRPRTAALTLHRNEHRGNHRQSWKINDLRLLALKLDSCQPTQEAVFEVMDYAEYTPFPKYAVILLNMIKDSVKGYYLIRWLNKKEEFEMNPIVYNVAMKVLRKGRLWDRVEDLLKEMLDRGMKPDNITYSTVISCATQCNLFHKAVEWFGRMKETGCLPDGVTYTTMVEAYSRNGQIQKALNFYEQGRADGWVPDVKAFGTILKTHNIAGDSNAVLKVLQEMKALGVKPNLVAYNIVFDVLAREGKPEAAKSLFLEMTDAGLTPNQVTLTCLMRVCAKARWTNYALKLWNSIKNGGWMKDTILYNAMLNICADAGIIEEATAIFEEMNQSDNCKPDERSYEAMLNLYAKRCQFEEVDRTLSEMMETGFKPTLIICTRLIQCYGKAKRFDDVVKIFNLLDERMPPDDKLCGSLVSVLTFSEKEEFDKVLECIEKANPQFVLAVKMLQEENVGMEVLQEEIRNVFNYISDGSRKHFCNCLIDLCYKFNFPERAHYFLHLGTMFGIYNNLYTKTHSEWCLDLSSLSMKSALTAFDGWISSLSKSLEDGEEMPPLLGIHTGHGTNYKQSTPEGIAAFFESHLKELNSPFEKSTERVGWFLTTRDPAMSWLQSRESSTLVTT